MFFFRVREYKMAGALNSKKIKDMSLLKNSATSLADPLRVITLLATGFGICAIGGAKEKEKEKEGELETME